MTKYSPLLTTLLIGVSTHAVAGDYFDPSLLANDIGNNEQIDLSMFSTPGGGLEGDREVNIYLNELFYKHDTLHFRNGPTGSLEPDFPVDFFDRLLAPQYQPVIKKEYISSEDFINVVPYSSVKFDQAKSRVDISIPQAYFGSDAQMKSSPESWTQGMPAFLIDYRFSGSKNQNDFGTAVNLYANTSLGLNMMGWRLRSTGNYTSYRTVDKYNRTYFKDSFDFYNTYMEHDIGKLRSTVRMGDLSTNGMITDSFNFIGGKLFSNDEMLNDRMRSYSPTVRGMASSNALVTITQNGRVILQKNVPPGPFELSDFALSGYSGDLQVHIREADGKEHSFVQPFSTLPEMKREGISGYEVSVGRYDNGGMSDYYKDTPFIYGSWSRGFNHGITLYSETIQSEKYQFLGGGSTLSLGEYGALSGDISISRADKNEKIQSGQSYGLKYSKNKLDTGTTVTLATYRYSTKDFYSFSDFVSKDDSFYNVWDNRLKNRFTISLNQSLGDYGLLSLSASKQNYWTSGTVNRAASLSHSFGWNGLYFSTSFSLDQTTGKNGLQNNNKTWGVNVNIPLNGLSNRSYLANSSVTYSTTKTNHRIHNTVAVSGNIPDTNARLRLNSGWGNGNQKNSRAMSLNWGNDFLDGSVGYARSGNVRTLDYNLNGATILYPWGMAFSSNSVMSGAAVVETQGVSGVKVRQGGKTSIFGTAIVSSIQPYTENQIDIEPQDLPEDIVISRTSRTIVPERGSVERLRYEVFKGKQVVFILKDREGAPLPFGSIVSLIGINVENSGIVDSEGRVYLAGVPKKGKLKATWGKNKSCEVNFTLQDDRKDSLKVVTEEQGVCN